MESGDEFLCYDADFSSVGKTGDHFAVDDLLDLPSDDAAADGGIVAAMNGASAESSPVTADSSSNSSSSVAVNATDSRFLPAADVGVPRYSAAGHFAGELCVPLEHYDELAQLEWMSNFADESFSKEDLLKIQLLQGIKPKPEPTETSPTLRPEPTGPTKARSKRPRLAGNWNSRLPTAAPPPSTAISSSSSSDTIKKAVKPAAHKKKDAHDGGDGRKCLHCSTDKTPQWRTGPMGPKTLCNACGVRFKSGRLVPEYRPASSPTFIMTKHSNSHRKVLELRRQKEMQKAPPQPVAPPYLHHHHHHHQNVMFDDDYLIHQHIGTDFR